MQNPLIRILAVILSASIVADPLSASAFSEPRSIKSNVASWVEPVMTLQAIPPSSTVARHLDLHVQPHISQLLPVMSGAAAAGIAQAQQFRPRFPRFSEHRFNDFKQEPDPQFPVVFETVADLMTRFQQTSHIINQNGQLVSLQLSPQAYTLRVRELRTVMFQRVVSNIVDDLKFSGEINTRSIEVLTQELENPSPETLTYFFDEMLPYYCMRNHVYFQYTAVPFEGVRVPSMQLRLVVRNRDETVSFPVMKGRSMQVTVLSLAPNKINLTRVPGHASEGGIDHFAWTRRATGEIFILQDVFERRLADEVGDFADAAALMPELLRGEVPEVRGGALGVVPEIYWARAVSRYIGRHGLSRDHIGIQAALKDLLWTNTVRRQAYHAMRTRLSSFDKEGIDELPVLEEMRATVATAIGSEWVEGHAAFLLENGILQVRDGLTPGIPDRGDARLMKEFVYWLWRRENPNGAWTQDPDHLPAQEIQKLLPVLFSLTPDEITDLYLKIWNGIKPPAAPIEPIAWVAVGSILGAHMLAWRRAQVMASEAVHPPVKRSWLRRWLPEVLFVALLLIVAVAAHCQPLPLPGNTVSLAAGEHGTLTKMALLAATAVVAWVVNGLEHRRESRRTEDIALAIEFLGAQLQNGVLNIDPMVQAEAGRQRQRGPVSNDFPSLQLEVHLSAIGLLEAAEVAQRSAEELAVFLRIAMQTAGETNVIALHRRNDELGQGLDRWIQNYSSLLEVNLSAIGAVREAAEMRRTLAFFREGFANFLDPEYGRSPRPNTFSQLYPPAEAIPGMGQVREEQNLPTIIADADLARLSIGVLTCRINPRSTTLYANNYPRPFRPALIIASIHPGAVLPTDDPAVRLAIRIAEKAGGRLSVSSQHSEAQLTFPVYARVKPPKTVQTRERVREFISGPQRPVTDPSTRRNDILWRYIDRVPYGFDLPAHAVAYPRPNFLNPETGDRRHALEYRFYRQLYGDSKRTDPQVVRTNTHWGVLPHLMNRPLLVDSWRSPHRLNRRIGEALRLEYGAVTESDTDSIQRIHARRAASIHGYARMLDHQRAILAGIRDHAELGRRDFMMAYLRGLEEEDPYDQLVEMIHVFIATMDREDEPVAQLHHQVLFNLFLRLSDHWGLRVVARDLAESPLDACDTILERAIQEPRGQLQHVGRQLRNAEWQLSAAWAEVPRFTPENPIPHPVAMISREPIIVGERRSALIWMNMEERVFGWTMILLTICILGLSVFQIGHPNFDAEMEARQKAEAIERAIQDPRHFRDAPIIGEFPAVEREPGASPFSYAPENIPSIPMVPGDQIPGPSTARPSYPFRTPRGDASHKSDTVRPRRPGRIAAPLPPHLMMMPDFSVPTSKPFHLRISAGPAEPRLPSGPQPDYILMPLAQDPSVIADGERFLLETLGRKAYLERYRLLYRAYTGQDMPLELLLQVEKALGILPEAESGSMVIDILPTTREAGKVKVPAENDEGSFSPPLVVTKQEYLNWLRNSFEKAAETLALAKLRPEDYFIIPKKNEGPLTRATREQLRRKSDPSDPTFDYVYRLYGIVDNWFSTIPRRGPSTWILRRYAGTWRTDLLSERALMVYLGPERYRREHIGFLKTAIEKEMPKPIAPAGYNNDRIREANNGRLPGRPMSKERLAALARVQEDPMYDYRRTVMAARYKTALEAALRAEEEFRQRKEMYLHPRASERRPIPQVLFAFFTSMVSLDVLLKAGQWIWGQSTTASSYPVAKLAGLWDDSLWAFLHTAPGLGIALGFVALVVLGLTHQQWAGILKRSFVGRWWAGWSMSAEFRQFVQRGDAVQFSQRLRIKGTSAVKRVYLLLFSIVILFFAAQVYDPLIFQSFTERLADWFISHGEVFALLTSDPVLWQMATVAGAFLGAEYFLWIRPALRDIRDPNAKITPIFGRFRATESRLNIAYSVARFLVSMWAVFYAASRMPPEYMQIVIVLLGGFLILLNLSAVPLIRRLQSGTVFLKVTGLYRYSRNPIYMSQRIGDLVLLAGALYFNGWGFLAAFAVVWLMNTRLVRWEEGNLFLRHGKRYADYLQGTSRWLSLPKHAA